MRDYLSRLRERTTQTEIVESDDYIREYIRFNYKADLEHWAEIVNVSKTVAAQAGDPVPAVYGNQACLSCTNYSRPGALALSPASDLIWNEVTGATVGARNCSASLHIRVADAASGYNNTKPKWFTGTPSADAAPAVLKRMLQTVIAEGLVFGAVHSTPLDAMTPDGDYQWDAVQELATFASENRVLFTDRTRLADVAVAYCFACVSWRHFSTLSSYDDPSFPNNTLGRHLTQMTSAAKLLDEQHLAWEVIILGHPDLYPEPMPMLSVRLRKTKLFILPNVDAISIEDQVTIEAWVRQGGVLWLWDESGTRDEELQKRTQTFRNLAAWENLIKTPGTGRVITTRRGTIQAMQAGLPDPDLNGVDAYRSMVTTLDQSFSTSSRLFHTDAPAEVAFSLFTHGNGPMMSVAFVRYADLDALDDSAVNRASVSFNVSVVRRRIVQSCCCAHSRPLLTTKALLAAPDLLPYKLQLHKGDILLAGTQRVPSSRLAALVCLPLQVYDVHVRDPAHGPDGRGGSVGRGRVGSADGRGGGETVAHAAHDSNALGWRRPGEDGGAEGGRRDAAEQGAGPELSGRREARGAHSAATSNGASAAPRRCGHDCVDRAAPERRPSAVQHAFAG